MNPKKKANIFVFLIIAVIAVFSGSFVYSITADFIPTMNSESSEKLIAITDNNFLPETIKILSEKPVGNNTTQIINHNWTDQNHTYDHNASYGDPTPE